MTPRLTAFLCFLAAPAAAQDACPRGPEVLDTGVRIVFDQGMQVEYLRQDDGRILETERHDGDPDVWLYISEPSGLIITSWMQGADGKPDETTRETYTYDFGGPMPAPEPDSNWTGTERSLIGGVWEEQLVSWSFSKPQDFEIGDCIYPAIWAHETRSSTDQPPWINRYVYLPDLNMAIYLGGDEIGKEPFLEVPLSISALSR